MAIQHTESEYLTLSEAANLMKVSLITIKRRVKQGRLPAYHAGSRAVRIRKDDLAQVLTLFSQAAKPLTEGFTGRRLSEAEAKELLTLLEEAETRGKEFLRRHGNRPLSPSWEIINEERDARSSAR